MRINDAESPAMNNRAARFAIVQLKANDLITERLLSMSYPPINLRLLDSMGTNEVKIPVSRKKYCLPVVAIVGRSLAARSWRLDYAKLDCWVNTNAALIVAAGRAES